MHTKSPFARKSRQIPPQRDASHHLSTPPHWRDALPFECVTFSTLVRHQPCSFNSLPYMHTQSPFPRKTRHTRPPTDIRAFPTTHTPQASPARAHNPAAARAHNLLQVLVEPRQRP